MSFTLEEYHQAFVEHGGMKDEDFQNAVKLATQNKSTLETVLVERGVLSSDHIGQLIANWMGVPYIHLQRTAIDKEVLGLVPLAFAQHHLVLPISQTTTKTKFATSEPRNLHLKSILEKYVRQPIEFVFATQKDIKSNLFRLEKDPRNVIESILSRKEAIGSTPRKIIDLVDSLIDHAHQFKASDIHIEPEEESTTIRFRMDGILQDIATVPKDVHNPLITRLKVLARLATDEHQTPQDRKIQHDSKWGGRVEIRVSVVPTTNGEKAVMRLLSEHTRTFNLQDLGFRDKDFATFQELIKHPWGMILVTGPTGSGKTTTLYGAVKVLNSRDINISTIEDPVEYDLQGVNQIQVNEKAELTFANGLRSLVRQDPDVIMVGEIRDPETASISVNAAMTGHLVISTLHTNDAATAFPRLLDMGIEDFLIASTVVSVIAQRLVRKLCMNCIESYKVLPEHKPFLSTHPDIENLLKEATGKEDMSSQRVYRGKGCKTCNNTGYHGRTGIFEILMVNDELREAIMSNKNADELRDIAIKSGMRTMLEDGIDKVILGHTSLQELLRVVQE